MVDPTVADNARIGPWIGDPTARIAYPLDWEPNLDHPDLIGRPRLARIPSPWQSL